MKASINKMEAKMLNFTGSDTFSTFQVIKKTLFLKQPLNW